MKKILPIVAVVLIAGLALTGCAMFKAAKAPVKECLAAWKKGDFETAYSYFSEHTNIYFEDFKAYAEENPIKAFKLNNISIGSGKGTVKGTVTLKDGTKLGCSFNIVEEQEDVWKIWDLEQFSIDLMME